MGITIGDVMTVIGIIVGVGLSAWATLVGMALICSKKAAEAEAYFEESPWRSLGVGALVAFTIGLVGVVMMVSPNPGGKLLGAIILSFVLAVAAIGGAGLARMVGSRIERMEGGASPYAALARGAGILVLISLVPFFGLFAYLPVATLISLGAGAQALIAKPRGETQAVSTQMPTGSAQA